MEDLRDLLVKVLKKIDPTIIEETLDIKFTQNFKDRYDVFGQFKNSKGIYEFAVSFDHKGNIKREHVNMIVPNKVKDELEKKVHGKGD
ncbi:hypothetical protein GWK48_05900 [Metallosphaera tengchongensis]|uniref:Uncharacterized protein n=1 Tax=Metallosphaera tengchongensis TaxID=1532350 RepID=A0A6N0NT00_9CREN|nr:hypothetical protein [Metallosphaera tengchongensis]QKQ99973.1 hypothetical protein GWK48_05900 [Metallosphaera tengchongensis]